MKHLYALFRALDANYSYVAGAGTVAARYASAVDSARFVSLFAKRVFGIEA